MPERLKHPLGERPYTKEEEEEIYGLEKKGEERIKAERPEHAYGQRPYTPEEEKEIYGEEWAEWAKKSEAGIKADLERNEELNEIEHPYGRRPYSPEEEKEIYGQEKPKKLTNLYGEVKQARQELAKLEVQYEEYKKHKPKEKGKIEEEYEQTKIKYEESQKAFLEGFLGRAKEKLSQEKFERVKKELLFDRFLVKEQERFSQNKQESLPSQDQSRFRKILGKITEKYSQLPKTARWGITAGIGTGIAFGVGSIAGVVVIKYAGFRFVRAALGSFSAAGIKGLGDGLEKLWSKKWGKEIREEKIKKSLREQAESVDSFEQISKLLMEKKEERNKELAKLAKAQKYWRVGKIAAMIGGGVGLALYAGHSDMLGSKAETAEVHDKLGLKPGEAPVVGGKAGPEGVPSPEAPTPPEAPVPEAPEIWEMKVGKGESPLLLAKKLYIEHAEKLGYESKMGDINKWAEIASTRHIVGQYISEHADKYKDLIDKIGQQPPKDPGQLDDWLDKVPKKTFNEILHQKVPNLIYEGDTVKVTETGDITAYSPEGKLRIGHLEVVEKATEKAAEKAAEEVVPEKVAEKMVPEPEFKFTHKLEGTEIFVSEAHQIETPSGSKIDFRYYDVNSDGKPDGAWIFVPGAKSIEEIGEIQYQPDKQTLTEFTQLVEQKTKDWIDTQTELLEKVSGREISPKEFQFLKECGIDPYNYEGFNADDMTKYNFLKNHPDLFEQPAGTIKSLFEIAQKFNLGKERVYEISAKIGYHLDLLQDAQGRWDFNQIRLLETLKGDSKQLIDALSLTQKLGLDYTTELNAARLKIDINNKEAIQELIGDKYKATKAIAQWKGDNLIIQIKRGILRKDIFLEPLKAVKT